MNKGIIHDIYKDEYEEKLDSFLDLFYLFNEVEEIEEVDE